MGVLVVPVVHVHRLDPDGLEPLAVMAVGPDEEYAVLGRVLREAGPFALGAHVSFLLLLGTRETSMALPSSP